MTDINLGFDTVSEDLPLPVKAMSGTTSIDQTTPGTTNAVYATEAAKVLDLTLSLDTAIYGAGDVLAATQELANAVRVVGGTARLDSIVVVDADAQAQPLTLYFFQSNVSIGTENAAASLADADALKSCGYVTVAAADYKTVGGVSIATVEFPKPINLKAESASTSVFVAAVTDSTPTHTAAGITLRIGVIRV